MVKHDSFLVTSINTNIMNYVIVNMHVGATMLVIELWQAFKVILLVVSSSNSSSSSSSPMILTNNSKRSRSYSSFYEVVNVCSIVLGSCWMIGGVVSSYQTTSRSLQIPKIHVIPMWSDSEHVVGPTRTAIYSREKSNVTTVNLHIWRAAHVIQQQAFW